MSRENWKVVWCRKLTNVGVGSILGKKKRIPPRFQFLFVPLGPTFTLKKGQRLEGEIEKKPV